MKARRQRHKVAQKLHEKTTKFNKKVVEKLDEERQNKGSNRY